MGDGRGPGCSVRSSGKLHVGIHPHDELLTLDFQSLRFFFSLRPDTRCRVILENVVTRIYLLTQAPRSRQISSYQHHSLYMFITPNANPSVLPWLVTSVRC